MITVPLTNEDLTKVRLAPSTLWETVISFRVLLHHGGDTVPVELLISCVQRDGAGGRPERRPGVSAQEPPPRTPHYDRARPPTPPEPRRHLSPPLAVEGSTARRAAPQRQESLLPTEFRRRVAARDLRRTGVDFKSAYPAHLC